MLKVLIFLALEWHGPWSGFLHPFVRRAVFLGFYSWVQSGVGVVVGAFQLGAGWAVATGRCHRRVAVVVFGAVWCSYTARLFDSDDLGQETRSWLAETGRLVYGRWAVRSRSFLPPIAGALGRSAGTFAPSFRLGSRRAAVV